MREAAVDLDHASCLLDVTGSKGYEQAKAAQKEAERWSREAKRLAPPSR